MLQTQPCPWHQSFITVDIIILDKSVCWLSLSLETVFEGEKFTISNEFEWLSTEQEQELHHPSEKPYHKLINWITWLPVILSDITASGNFSRQ